MRSVANLRTFPAGRPLTADEVLEFHASRILLLLRICGQEGKIKGLTKLAKLDFFTRYPDFLARAARELGHDPGDLPNSVEAPMIRHYYGPWDRRYYHVIAYLESRGLIRVTQPGARTFQFQLTPEGEQLATKFEGDGAFADLRSVMLLVGKVLGAQSGSWIKAYIYRLFDQEVAARRLGEVISA